MNEVKELVEFDKIAAGMSEIQAKGNFLPDTTTKEGYEASKRFVLDVTTPTRTSLDKAHKSAKAFWVAGGKVIDSKKNELMDLLVEIQKPHQEAYKEFDKIEKDKKEKFESDIQEKIKFFTDFMFIINGTSEFVTTMIDSCGEVDTIEGFYHRGADAVKAKSEAMNHLNDLLLSTINREAEEKRQIEFAEENRLRQIEIDKQQESMRLQQEEIENKQAELYRAENEAIIKKRNDDAEKKRLIDEAELAEREKQAAIEREEYAVKQSKEAAEKAKQDEINRQKEIALSEKEAAEKREANKRHNAKINNEILKVLIDNEISKVDAKTVVILAAKRLLPNVSINY